MKHSIPWFILFLALTSCASASKKIADIDSILGKPAEQQKTALSELCSKGNTSACALLGERRITLKRALPIMQSLTSETQARFVVVVPADETLNYFVRAPGLVTRLTPERMHHPDSNTATDQLEAFALNVKLAYELVVIGPDGMVWDRRSFRALDNDRHRARLAVISGLDDAFSAQQAQLWPQLLAQKPDAILMVGDTVYPEKEHGSDATTPDLLWKKYVESRAHLALFRADPLVPVIALWDEEDYGQNNGNRTYPQKFAAMDAFFAFFPQRKAGPGFDPGPGVSAWWSAFGVHFALMDCRTFRSPDGLDVKDQTHFGSEGEQWLREQLAQHKEPAFIVSGDQFFGGYHPFESYEGSHPKRFKTQVEEWAKVKQPLLFISGNRHLSEIIKVPTQLGYPTYELTSSGMHERLNADAFAKYPNPHQLAGVDGQNNYLIVELMRSNQNFIQLDVQAFAGGGRQLFQKPLTVKH